MPPADYVEFERDLIRSINHVVRTPLNAALSAIQILQERIGTSLLEAEYLNVASTSMLATAAALDNITLKGESMQFAVSSGEQDMGSILNDLVVHFTDRVEKGNIHQARPGCRESLHYEDHSASTLHVAHDYT